MGVQLDDSKKEYKNLSIYEYAKLYVKNGLNIIPLQPNDKKPRIEWKDYQEGKRLSDKEIEDWFKYSFSNVGIICGTVSENLVVIDFDSLELYQKWINSLDSNLKSIIENTWVVETGRGIHVYLRIKINKDTFKQLFRTKTKVVDSVDIKAEGGYVVAPPSLHPSGKQYRFIKGSNTPIAEVSKKKFKEILDSIEKIAGKKDEEREKREDSEELDDIENKGGKQRGLTNAQILEIIDLFKPFYHEGDRFEIVGSLIATLIKLQYSCESIRQLIDTMTTALNDEEKKDRLYLVDYHCNKKVQQLGKKKLKGISGIRKVVEKTLFNKYRDAERAKGETLEFIRRFNEILGVRVEKDSIFAITKSSENIVQYFANDRKWGITFVTKRNGITTTEPILDYYIEKVKVQINPRDATDRTYSIYFRSPFSNTVLTFEERKLNSIIEHFEKNIASVRNILKLKSAIHSIASRFEELKIAEIEPKASATGFFEVDGKLQHFETRLFPTHLPEFDRERDREKVARAFKKLDELLSFWDYKPNVIANLYFDIQSPIEHIRKAYGRENKVLYNYGTPHVGKTFKDRIYCAVWGLDENKVILDGANLTIPQLAYYMSISTYKVALDEGFNTLINQYSADMIKKSTTTYHIKSRITKNDYETVEFEDYASLSINTNFDPLKYPGLPERLIPIRWTLRDKKSEKEFNELVNKFNKYREDLGYIGAYLKDMFIRRWDEVKEILLNNDNIEAGRKLLEMALEELGLEKPVWLKPVEINYNIESQRDEDILFDFIREDINNELAKHRYNVKTNINGETYTEDMLEKSWEEKLEYMATHSLLPGYLKLGRRVVFIKKSVEDEIRRRKGYILTGGLEDIAYKIGGKYYPNGERGISMPISDFIKRMNQRVDDDELLNEEQQKEKENNGDKSNLENFF